MPRELLFERFHDNGRVKRVKMCPNELHGLTQRAMGKFAETGIRTERQDCINKCSDSCTRSIHYPPVFKGKKSKRSFK